VHNNGLLRENTRLMLALDILDHEPTRTADEALCHAFAMSDDHFVCRYPDASKQETRKGGVEGQGAEGIFRSCRKLHRAQSELLH
jgi:hypothetical protein